MNEPRSPKGDNDGKAVANTTHSPGERERDFLSLVPGWPAEQLAPTRLDIRVVRRSVLELRRKGDEGKLLPSTERLTCSLYQGSECIQ
jgi:hypothetical protein